MLHRTSLVAVIALAGIAAGAGVLSLHTGAADVPARATADVIVARRDFVRSIRLSGTVEALQATNIIAPRIAGQNNNALVIERLVKNGTRVHRGDLIVEFDRQDQLQNALDQHAVVNDDEQQIRKREADEAAAKATDDDTLKQAQDALAKAKFELLKNEFLSQIDAEKNTVAYEEAQALWKQLQETYTLKREDAAADIKILEIARDRADETMREAQSNAERMLITSPIDGVAVVKQTWKNGGNMLEYDEGDEVRPGQAVVQVVNPAVMRVRARVNQADINELRRGQPVHVGLDAYPDLSFSGVVDQISPIGAQSTLNPKVRTFVVLVLVNGSNPSLMPDLTASLDVELERTPHALVVPRDTVVSDGEQTYVLVRRGDRLDRQSVTLGPSNAFEVVVSAGLREGTPIVRNAAGRQ